MVKRLLGLAAAVLAVGALASAGSGTTARGQSVPSGSVTIGVIDQDDRSAAVGVINVLGDPDRDGNFDTVIDTVDAPATIVLPYERYHMQLVSTTDPFALVGPGAPVLLSVDAPIETPDPFEVRRLATDLDIALAVIDPATGNPVPASDPTAPLDVSVGDKLELELTVDNTGERPLTDLEVEVSTGDSTDTQLLAAVGVGQSSVSRLGISVPAGSQRVDTSVSGADIDRRTASVYLHVAAAPTTTGASTIAPTTEPPATPTTAPATTMAAAPAPTAPAAVDSIPAVDVPPSPTSTLPIDLPTEPPSGQLPDVGSAVGTWTIVALAMIGAGLLLLFARRRPSGTTLAIVVAGALIAAQAGGSNDDVASAQVVAEPDFSVGGAIAIGVPTYAPIWRGTAAAAAMRTPVVYGDTRSSGDMLVLSTGDAASYLDGAAPDMNASTVLPGRNSDDGFDQAGVELGVIAPTRTTDGAAPTCLAVTFRMASEEYPQWRGSEFDDRIDLSISARGGEVLATLDDAFGSPYSLNNDVMEPIGNGPFDGSSPFSTVLFPLDGSTAYVLAASVTDVGDDLYDTVLMLDDIYWVFDRTCDGELLDMGDLDGDGLPNEWETNGADVDLDGVVDIPLHELGADPMHKDVYLEVDYSDEFAINPGNIDGAAFDIMRDEFAEYEVDNPDGTPGINLHIDSGPDAPITSDDTVTWGAQSEGQAVDTSGFQRQPGGPNVGQHPARSGADSRDVNSPTDRRPVFRYVLAAPRIEGAAGWAGRGGNWLLVRIDYLNRSSGAALLSHELGHSIDLGHGGGSQGLTNKPHYLSIMNYRYAYTLRRDDELFLRLGHDGFEPLDETNLDEAAGVTPNGTAARYEFVWVCPDGEQRDNDGVAAPIDWNCDGSIESGLSADINGDGEVDSVLDSPRDLDVIDLASSTIGNWLREW